MSKTLFVSRNVYLQVRKMPRGGTVNTFINPGVSSGGTFELAHEKMSPIRCQIQLRNAKRHTGTSRIPVTIKRK